MYKKKATDRIYKEGEEFALIQVDNNWEQTDTPNEALKGEGFEPVKQGRAKKDEGAE